MKKIPLNSLVFLIDVTSEQVADRFEPHEFISFATIGNTLVGDAERPDLKSLFLHELQRIVNLKLSLGQRVVVDVPDMRRDVRISMARTGTNRGHSVFYIVDDLSIRRDLVRGDRLAEVVDLNQTQAEVIRPLPDVDFFTHIQARGFNGITVVADVHGMMNSLRNAISWAKSRNHFLLFLGDLIDYGIDTLEVVEEVYQLVTRGEAEALIGNHERKIYKYLTQIEQKGTSHIRLSEGNKVTVNRIENLSKFDHERWVSRFKSLVNMMRNHRVSHNFIFAHGAVLPEVWGITDARLSGEYEEVTMFGEVDDSQRRLDGYPNRVYNWVENLKPNQTAIVGHDIRSDFKPLIQTNKAGGQAIFLDTGCGKGGHLSTLDIRFSGTSARVENFNVH
jgi:cyclophilin family peptidyl-prolyl cis-trans isomerase